MVNKKVIVNLGCGTTRIPGNIGVDRLKIKDFVDVVHDLDKVPYPFKSKSVDEIYMYHVLEHLHDPLKKMEEIHRILKPGGILHIRVPHFSSAGAFTDMTHLRPFSYLSFNCFEKNDAQHYYTSVNFKILKRRIKYSGLYPNSETYQKYFHPNECLWLLKPYVKLMDYLINRSPMFFERIWCYWVGGARELIIDLKRDE